MRLFISYARIDKPFCTQFVNMLDVHEVWYDQRLYAGQRWWEEILRRLEWCEGFIYLMSPHSVASEYCLKELEIAQRLGRVVIPVLIDADTEIPQDLQQLQYLDVSRGMSVESVKEVLNAIYRVENPREAVAVSQSSLAEIGTSVKSSPVMPSAQMISQGANAFENGDYDKAVLLFRQAKASGFQSRFIQIDRLLSEAERALEVLVREREAKREYEHILELFHYKATRPMAVEAFLAFQEEFKDYDPENLKAQCVSGKAILVKSIDKKEFSPASFTLPLLEWCEVSAGYICVQDPRTHQDKRIAVEAFAISKYPVTNAQYEVFVTDSRGYCNPQWWKFSKSASAWFGQYREALNPHFAGLDHPRETVNWYEALAFSRWLGHKLKADIMLPTLAQWSRAALGDEDRLYPWGQTFNPEACNTRESGLKMTTPVKRYSEGVSAFGAYDMLGNVWEWCLDRLEPENEGGDFRRAVIGGSFVSPSERTQAAFRYFLNPESRYSSIGFRIVRLQKSANLAN